MDGAFSICDKWLTLKKQTKKEAIWVATSESQEPKAILPLLPLLPLSASNGLIEIFKLGLNVGVMKRKICPSPRMRLPLLCEGADGDVQHLHN